MTMSSLLLNLRYALHMMIRSAQLHRGASS